MKEYPTIEESADNKVAESVTIPLTKLQSEQLEALWTSLFSTNAHEVETAQHLYVKESLHRAFENMRKAEKTGEKEQDLDSFLDEL